MFVRFLTFVVLTFLQGWMAMFAVALVGIPLGFWPCVVAVWVIKSVIAAGVDDGINLYSIGKN